MQLLSKRLLNNASHQQSKQETLNTSILKSYMELISGRISLIRIYNNVYNKGKRYEYIIKLRINKYIIRICIMLYYISLYYNVISNY